MTTSTRTSAPDTTSNRFAVDHLTPADWRRTLEAGRRRDVERHAGLWDARSGAINLWASPEDRPSGWPADLAMTAGAFPAPREFVASLWLDWDEPPADLWRSSQHFPIVCEITIYAVEDSARARWCAARDADPTGVGPPRLGADALRMPGDTAWIAAKWADLRAAALVEAAR